MLTYHKFTGHKIGEIETNTDIKIRENKELRLYDNGNYVGFKAPALSADQIWALPTADGNNLEVLRTDGNGILSWATAAAGAGTFELDDDDSSHVLTGIWNEAETTSNRNFNFIVNGGNRTLDLSENFKVLDGQDIELHASGGEKAQLAIDTQNVERTLDLTGNLTIAGNLVTQNNNLTINAVDAARTLTLTENFTIGGGSAGTLTYSAGSKTLTVANDCTVNQNLQTTDDPTFDDLTVDKIEANECFTFDAFQTATGDGTTTMDWGLGNLFYFTFGTQNDTFTFTAPPGSARLVLVLKQDTGGGGSRLATWPGTVLWPGNVAPTLTTAADSVDIVTLIYDGTNYFGLFNGNFS